MSKYVPKIDLAKLVAIDVHTHAEVSSRAPRDPCSMIFDEAMAKYFKEAGRPTIPQVAQYYRERKMAAVIFTVDSEAEIGVWRIANEEVAEVAAEHSDVLIPFASIDPARGKMGAREARRLIEEYGVRGFKFHPSSQGFFPNDRKAYGLYEVIQGHKLPALFHTGQTGFGAQCGAAAACGSSTPTRCTSTTWRWISPTCRSSWRTHRSRGRTRRCRWPRTSRKVYIDLSGWSPKYFPANLVQYANTLLRHKMLFGSDFPVLTPDRWLADFAKIDIKPEVRPLILKDNAIKLLGLA